MSMIIFEQSYKLLVKFNAESMNPIISALYHVRNLACSDSVYSVLKTKCISLITGICRVLGDIQGVYH